MSAGDVAAGAGVVGVDGAGVAVWPRPVRWEARVVQDQGGHSVDDRKSRFNDQLVAYFVFLSREADGHCTHTNIHATKLRLFII